MLFPTRHFPDPRRLKPNPELANPEWDAVVALGWPVEANLLDALKEAYAYGIFPWPIGELGEDPKTIPWFCPDPRGVLEFKNLTLPKSLKKDWDKLKSTLEIRFNSAFSKVIQACAEPRKTASDEPASPRTPHTPQTSTTWITRAMQSAYVKLHETGMAHSVEIWEQGELTGGLYGVSVHGCFSGESMFYRKPNRSKFALLALIEHLRKQGQSWELDWIDIQQLTPHFEKLGATEIPRPAFLKKLEQTQKKWKNQKEPILFPAP